MTALIITQKGIIKVFYSSRQHLRQIKEIAGRRGYQVIPESDDSQAQHHQWELEQQQRQESCDI